MNKCGTRETSYDNIEVDGTLKKSGNRAVSKKRSDFVYIYILLILLMR